MTNNEPVIPPPVFQDRKTLLVVFGILHVFLGAMCALLAPLALVGLVVSKYVPTNTTASTNITMMIMVMFFYVLLAVWFIWMGIGSIKARRWARALILVSSWLWLVIGVLMTVMMLFYIPNMFGNLPQTNQMPQAFFLVMKAVTAFFLLILYIVIPGMFVLVYRGENIKRTCEFWDRQVRWTDQCPLPVLALVLFFGMGAFSFLSMLFYKGLFPLFGTLVQGLPGIAIVLALAVLFGYISRGMYRLDSKAWWVALIAILLIGTSTIVTFLQISLWDLYTAMGYSEQQIELMKQYGIQDNPIMKLMGLWAIPIVGYLLFARKYFVKTK